MARKVADKSPKGTWRFTDVATELGVSAPVVQLPGLVFRLRQRWLAGPFRLRLRGQRRRRSSPPIISVCLIGAERPRLYHNNGDGTFTDVTQAAGLYRVLLAMAANFGDLDNDGFLDFYLGTGAPI